MYLCIRIWAGNISDHSSLFRTVFYFRLAQGAKVWSVPCFPLRLEREITFGELHVTILRKLRQPHVLCQVFNILLGHMFRSFVNSVPFYFSRSQKPDSCVKVKTTSHGACTLLLFVSVNPRPGSSIRRQEIPSCYGQCFSQRHQMEYVSSKFQIWQKISIHIQSVSPGTEMCFQIIVHITWQNSWDLHFAAKSKHENIRLISMCTNLIFLAGYLLDPHRHVGFLALCRVCYLLIKLGGFSRGSTWTVLHKSLGPCNTWACAFLNERLSNCPSLPLSPSSRT